MDLLHFTYFQKVAQMEHMTKAARELRIAQPALSAVIARLEADLGVPLFDRQGRQIKLNVYGKAYLNKVESALRMLEEGRREVAELAGLEHGSVVVAATTLNRLSKLLGDFLSLYPEVQFRIIQSSTENAKIQLIEDGQIDFSFSYQPYEKPSFRSFPLMKEEIMLAVPPNHPFREYTSIPLLEAAEESFISLKKGYGFREITDLYCQEAGFTPKMVVECDEPAAISKLVKAGLGVAFLPFAAQKEAPNLPLLQIERPVCQWTLYLIWKEDHYFSQAALLFRDFLVQFFDKVKQIDWC
ncbi:LysR family transcriptional regulator [Shimazuella sp. AN120528]|uniref:LysR family transcriptional regulator n=1 Tax=Shimazuella soli TaxID=1892854 RepID=UPI001F0D5F77|nr:LysR family transcriptional regulator [Shimazuella soli]MCH5583965.1 LysR family transcriptional regulator [Shimazuella soli]